MGDDDLGRRALGELQEHGVNTHCVDITPDYPTGTVQVEVDKRGKPSYAFAANVAWDHLQWSDKMAELAARTDAVCFGTLAQRERASRQTIRRFLEATPETCLRVFDVNLRQQFYDDERIRESLHLASVLKLSDDELPIVAKACGVDGAEKDAVAALRERFDLQNVTLTRGDAGSLLVSPASQSNLTSQRQIEVKDTVGAGDAFAATMTLGLLLGLDLDAINRHASRVAAYVCTQAGRRPSCPKS